MPGGGRSAAAGPLPRRAPAQTKACYEIPVSLLSRPSPAQNKPLRQQKRRPPSAGAVYLAQGRAAVPAARLWQPPNRFAHRARCGLAVQERDAKHLDWHRSGASEASCRGSRLPGEGDAPLCTPSGIARPRQSCRLRGATVGLRIPGRVSGRCLLCPGVDKAHDEGEALLNKQLRTGQSEATRAAVTELQGRVDGTLLRLGTGGGNASRGRTASSAGGEWCLKSGWP